MNVKTLNVVTARYFRFQCHTLSKIVKTNLNESTFNFSLDFVEVDGSM